MTRTRRLPTHAGQRLAAMRRKAGFARQEDLAAASGLSQQRISDLERMPSLRACQGGTLLALAQTLGTTVEGLLEGS